MKLTLICLLLFGAAMASAAPPKGQPPTADALKEAAGLLDQGRFREAAETFQRADELAGGSCGPCLLGLSRAQLALKQPEKSADAARKAVAALHASGLIGQAWNQLGMALISRSRPDLAGAEEAFRKAVAVPGGQLAIVASYNLADVLWREKKYAESEQFARAALVADPAGPAARNARIVLCQARADGAPTAPEEARYVETCRWDGRQTFDDKVSRPEKIFGADPQYDQQNLFEGVGGAVIVETIVDEEGCVQEARVCKSLRPELDRDAWEKVRRWVFQPATLEGKPVKVHYTLTIKFKGRRPGPG
ncbi:MAG: TonB family protein [Thermoanaerobaculia bacterium]